MLEGFDETELWEGTRRLVAAVSKQEGVLEAREKLRLARKTYSKIKQFQKK